MTTTTEAEVFYWSEVPVGAIVITAMARRVQGRYAITAQVKNPPVMALTAQAIPLDHIEPGTEVYVSDPTGPGTLIEDLVMHRVAWGQPAHSALAAQIRRMSATEPLRGVVPYRIWPNEVTPGVNAFPVNCYVVVCRKPVTIKKPAEYLMWRRWQSADGQQQTTRIPLRDWVAGVPTYVRTSYLEPGAALTNAMQGTFMAVDWTDATLSAIDDDMRFRTEPRRIDKAEDTLDIATYYVNQVAVATQVAIMAVNPDKRTDVKQIGWLGFISWALAASKKKAHETRAIRAERMR